MLAYCPTQTGRDPRDRPGRNRARCMCIQKNFGVGNKIGSAEKQLLATETLPLPAAADKLKSCIVAGNVQIKQSGEATIAIYG